ncbi:MAG: PorT family protein [Cyclobacteriaceae bacterium]|nr:PorT family protein [Cyclobacteriaceae bacterium]MCK5701354.1 PorT family protein [Cyclobacteriaceae bacterium]
MLAKKLLLFLLFLFFLNDASAQFSIGVQGGSNLSKMDFTNNPEYRFTEVNYTQGFIGGIVIQYLNEKHAGVQAEFNYTQRGWNENDTTAGNNLKFKNQVNYIEMPILTHVNIGGGKLRGLFNIGPYIAYALSAKKSVEDLNSGSEESADYTFNSDTDNRLDFGLLVGGGFEYRFSFGKFAAEARYTIGLGDINKIKIQQSELSQFRVVSVLVRFTIPLIKPKKDPKL